MLKPNQNRVNSATQYAYSNWATVPPASQLISTVAGQRYAGQPVSTVTSQVPKNPPSYVQATGTVPIGIKTKNVQNFAHRNPQITKNGIIKRQRLIRVFTGIFVVAVIGIIGWQVIPRISKPKTVETTREIEIFDVDNSETFCIDFNANLTFHCTNPCEINLKNNCHKDKYKNKLDYVINISGKKKTLFKEFVRFESEHQHDFLTMKWDDGEAEMDGADSFDDSIQMTVSSSNFWLNFRSDGSVARTGYEIVLEYDPNQ